MLVKARVGIPLRRPNLTFDLTKAIILSHPVKVLLLFPCPLTFTLSFLEEQSHVQDVFLEVIRIYGNEITRKTVIF